MEMQERPPYVRFEVRAEEDRQASVDAGHYVAKNVVFALITPPGSKDVVEKVAEEWLAQIKDKANKGEYPPEWSRHFHAAYEQWKEQNTIPENGTPIIGWQLISPAMQKQVLSANVRTVEDLATLNEAGLSRIGMGARDLQNKARAWIEEGASRGKVAAQNAALQVENEQMKERIAALEAQVNEMAGKLSRKRKQQPQTADED